MTSEVKRKMEMLYPRGFIDSEVAEMLGIKEQTINNWKKQDPAFFESIKGWKSEANEKVKRALFERACGYSHPEDKILVADGQAVTIPTIKHYPPDTGACMAWLKNRDPENWRDQVQISNDPNNPILPVIEVRFVGESEKS